MASVKSTFETINPSRFTTLTFPNPENPSSLLRVAVLDSPGQPGDPPRVAAMLVPTGRESDWLFSGESGHRQLLLAAPLPRLSRLVLVGNLPNDDVSRGRSRRNDAPFGASEASLRPLLLALSPRSCFERGIPEIPVLRYEDGVVSSVVLGVFRGSSVGEMLVEDVEIDGEFRRRLRFKRMPNLVQTQVKIVPEIGESEFRLDLKDLVHPYLAPMAASLRLAGERILAGVRPRALCLGVGGGALTMFLANRLKFEVWGVEEDDQVLRVGREFFGLEEGEFVKLLVGDAMEFVQRVARGESYNGFRFDVVMVDLDSCDLEHGVCAPPLEFRRKRVLLDTKSILSDEGIVVVNVVPQSSEAYEDIKSELREVFGDLYEIDVGNGENFVLIGSKFPGSSSLSNCDNAFVGELGKVVSEAFVDSIRKL